MPIKSPFPGMDPWLESHWGDIHQRIVLYACDQMQAQLPGELRARLQERVYVETPKGPSRVVYPDVRVVERPELGRGFRESSAVATLEVAEPVIVRVKEPVTEGYVEIVEAGTGQKVITVIEVLSRANKTPGPGQVLYLRKQRECQEARVNLVEIDLRRSGIRDLIVPTSSIPKPYRTTYQVCVWRGVNEIDAEVYAVPLQAPLPSIRIPLRSTDADIRLDLQPLIDQAYRNGGYDDIDYKIDPEPPLDPNDAEWANQILRERGLR